MDIASAATIVAALATGEPTRPLLTFYDDATGERTELSRATMANWVAKTANLLVTGLGLRAGDLAAVRLPPHWQTAAVLLGCWSAGLRVGLGAELGADPRPDPGAEAWPEPVPVAFVTADLVGAVDADDVLALALAPLAAALRPGPPRGSTDFVLEVRGHGDHFAPPSPIRPDLAALADGTSHAGLLGAAAARHVPAGARILIDADAVRDPVTWLVAPLLAGASVVLCRHLDPARLPARLASERATPFP